MSALIGTAVVLVVAELAFWLLPLSDPTPRFIPTGNDRIVRFHPNRERVYSRGWKFDIINPDYA